MGESSSSCIAINSHPIIWTIPQIRVVERGSAFSVPPHKFLPYAWCSPGADPTVKDRPLRDNLRSTIMPVRRGDKDDMM